MPTTVPEPAPVAVRARVPGRRTAIAIVSAAMLVAAYTGFRVPNAWSATLQSVSLFDGFHRRFAIGTVLRPLALATDYDYRLFAGFSYAVLIAVLGVLGVAAIRSPLWTRRMLIVAWLLLPAGGFLFNEVGYFEQVLYLLLFAGTALAGRGRLVAAACVIAVAPLVHEIAILTVLPVFGLFVLRREPARRAVAATAPAVVLNAIALVVSPVSPGGIATLEAALAHANFTYRIDALALFERTQAESWKLYKIHDLVIYLMPTACVLIAAYLVVWWVDRNLWRRPAAPPPRAMRALVLVASCVAIAAPALLMFAGWDGNRWLFLLIGNFFLVMWLSLGDGRRTELGPAALATLVVVVLLLARIQLWYFDRLAPRELGYRPVKTFLHHVVNGKAFEMANE